MPELPDSLQTDNHLLWVLIGVSIAMVLTLDAIQSAVDGAWPHQHRPSRLLPHERTAQSIWGVVALLVIAGGLLLITNLGILLWQDIDYGDNLVLGSILLAVGWVVFMLTSIESFGIRRYLSSIGPTAPMAVMVVLIAAIVLLVLSLLDIVPPWEEFQDALPIIYAPMRSIALLIATG
ncbi:MAG: hypothetical protein R2848_04090 [Thermomicrobiales bacterium]